MNCTECREKLVELIEGLLPESDGQAIEGHINDCSGCKEEFEQLKQLNERIENNGKVWQKTSLQEAVLKQIDQEKEKFKQADKYTGRLRIWRKIMTSKFTKLTTAAAIIIAAVTGATIFNQTVPCTEAAEILKQAINAVSDIWSVHMTAKMRTLPNDNFSNIGLNYDFQKIEMWKQTDPNGFVKWRVEKPGRVLLMDGKTTTMFIRPSNTVNRENRPLPVGCFDSWSGRFLNVHNLLENELKSAKNKSVDQMSLYHKDIDGQDKIILEIEVKANVPQDDYVYNKFITDSDHLKIYQFDANTKLLEALQVFVHTGKDDVLIFEVTGIEYNQEFDKSVFALDLPDNANWYKDPEVLSDNEIYENMSPKEAATAFFQACSDEDWNEVLKFWYESKIDDRIKKYFGGLKIVSIGEPFQSKGYASENKGWFVPYEISLKPSIKNVQLSKDNPAGRFVIIGWYDENMKLKEKEKWSIAPQILQDNETYTKMAPEQVVEAYFDALLNLDWDQMKKFVPAKNVEKLQNECEGAKLYNVDIKKNLPRIEVVKSFWSEEHSSYIVTFKEYHNKKFNLAIRKDNRAKRFVIDGGL